MRLGWLWCAWIVTASELVWFRSTFPDETAMCAAEGGGIPLKNYGYWHRGLIVPSGPPQHRYRRPCLPRERDDTVSRRMPARSWILVEIFCRLRRERTICRSLQPAGFEPRRFPAGTVTPGN